MKYQLVKELAPECLIVQNEAGEKFIFDKIPFAVPPRVGLRKEIQKEIGEIIETERTIKASGLIKYLALEKYGDELYLIRENSRSFAIKDFEGGNIEETCRALLQILKIMQVYHRNEIALGGVSIGLLKQAGNDFYLQDPLIFNHLSKSLTEAYHIQRPPEVIQGGSWSRESDIFSWGVVAYHLLTGVEPYRAASQEEKVAKILRGSVIPLNDLKPQLSAALNKLVIGCLNKDPLKRPKVDQLITLLGKLMEEQALFLPENEIKKVKERAELNRIKFKLQESVWLWFRKYGKILGIGFGIVLVFAWMFIWSKSPPTITASTTPDQVIAYYFQGVKEVNVPLVDEATHKVKNDLSNMVVNVHVLNTTNKSVDPAAKNLIKIEIEEFNQEKLYQKPDEVKYRIGYRIKIIAPRVVEYLEREDEYVLNPIKGVWRITDIKVLKQKNWREEIETAPVE